MNWALVYFNDEYHNYHKYNNIHIYTFYLLIAIN